jgi:hypothetical protein
MLPDFPKSKSEMIRLVGRRIHSLEIEEHPILAQLQTFKQYEGRSIQYEQVDFGKKIQQAEEKQVMVEIKFNEVPTLVRELGN